MRTGKAMMAATTTPAATHGQRLRRERRFVAGSPSSSPSVTTSRSTGSPTLTTNAAYDSALRRGSFLRGLGRLRSLGHIGHLGHLGRLGCRLLFLLVGAHLPKRLGIDDVGDRQERARTTEVAGRLLPSRRLHTELLAEQADEDAGLLLSETGQAFHVAQQMITSLGRLPHVAGLAVVVVDDPLTELLDPAGHRAR